MVSKRISQVKKEVEKKGADTVLKVPKKKRSPIASCEGGGCSDACKDQTLHSAAS